MKNFLRLFLVSAFVVLSVSHPLRHNTSVTNILGNWQGTLTIPGSKLGVLLKITEPAKGQISGSLDLPDAGANNLPLQHLDYTDRILSF